MIVGGGVAYVDGDGTGLGVATCGMGDMAMEVVGDEVTRQSVVLGMP